MERKKSNRRFNIFIILTGVAVSFLVVYSIQSCSLSRNTIRDLQAEQASGRKWAEPIELAGLANLYKVSDNLYRGAQPTQEGFKNLKQLGIKTIINLRDIHSDTKQIADSNFFYEQIEMKVWDDAEDKDVVRFLQIVSDKEKQPVFVHCRYGSDRTGMMCAVYRIVVEGWSKQQAIDEMTKGGFGFHPAYHNLITYIEKLDTEKIRQDKEK